MAAKSGAFENTLGLNKFRKNTNKTAVERSLKQKHPDIYLEASLTFKARWRDLRREDAKAENKHWEGVPLSQPEIPPSFKLIGAR